MARRDPLQGGLVPVAGPDGAIQWQTWEYGELLRHLNSDLDLTGNDSLPVVAQYAPGYEWAYVQRTTSVTVTSGTETAAGVNLLLTAPSFIADGSPVMGEFYAPFIETGAAAGSDVLVNWGEGSTLFGRVILQQGGWASGLTFGGAYTGYGRWRFTPTAGAHTYFVGAWGSGLSTASVVGSGTGAAVSYPPMFLRFTKV